MKPPPGIIRAKRNVEKQLLALPGVTGVDIGFKESNGRKTKTIAIRVLVKEKKDVPPDQQVPKTIGGFPTDVIEREFKLHAIDEASYRPLIGGISCGPCRLIGGTDLTTGTLGCLVVDRESPGDLMLLSNYHVLCGSDDDQAIGDTIVQPGRVDGGSCPDEVVATLTRWEVGGSVDCAVATLAEGITAVPQIEEIGAIIGTGEVELGDAVKKRGRTSRLKHGIVDSIDLSTTTDFGAIGSITLTGQIGISPLANDVFGESGDSGSAVVNSRRQVVGLYYAGNDAGYGIANPIQLVLDALDVDLYVGEVGENVFIEYPSTLPLPYFEASGQTSHALLASPESSSKIARRLRFKGLSDLLSVRWVLNPSQYYNFKNFFKQDLRLGAGQFTIELRYPKTTELTTWVVQFIGGLEFVFLEGMWEASAQMYLVRKLDLPDLAAVLGTAPFYVESEESGGEPQPFMVEGDSNQVFLFHVEL